MSYHIPLVLQADFDDDSLTQSITQKNHRSLRILVFTFKIHQYVFTKI